MHKYKFGQYSAKRRSDNKYGTVSIRKYQAGVTLIELIGVLAMVAIMLSMALPSYRDMVTRNRSATQVNEFLVAIILARSEALKIGSSVSVQAADTSDTGNEFGKGWCVVAANPGSCNDPVLRSFPALVNDTVLNSVENNTAIVFNAYGELASGAVQNIDLCVSGSGTADADRRVFITLVGRPEAHRPDDATTAKRPSCT